MDHVENDMDDLFQKAGELYPLNTGNSDWEGVLAKLDTSNNMNEAVPLNEKLIPSKRKRRWLLLLLPLIITSYIYFRNYREDTGSKPPVALQRSTVDNPKSTVTKNNKTNPSNNLPKNNINAGKDFISGLKEIHKINESSIHDRGNLKTDQAFDQTNLYPESKWKPLTITPAEFYSTPHIEGNPLPVSYADSNLTTGINDTKDSKTKKVKNDIQGLYIGFVAGPDISNVDFQQVSKMGFTLGMIAGYRFNNRLSIETGLYWDKKFYYSDGNYFKPDKGISSYVDISQVKGYCDMFELPIAIRLDFAVKKNHRFFAKAGLSSYFMQNENYNIKGYVSPPGSATLYFDKDTSYAHSPSNIFSIVQLSLGYETSIGKNTKLRLEPYIKIPTQGIGYGNLLISSTGLLLGFSYSFR
jgi:Outer membrane protein beta-barrel domain